MLLLGLKLNVKKNKQKYKIFLLWISCVLVTLLLQSVEEAECRSAYESATEVYMSSFDSTKPPEEVGVDSWKIHTYKLLVTPFLSSFFNT